MYILQIQRCCLHRDRWPGPDPVDERVSGGAAGPGGKEAEAEAQGQQGRGHGTAARTRLYTQGKAHWTNY